MNGREILKNLTESKIPSKRQSNPTPQRTSGTVRALQTELGQIAEDAATGKVLQEAIEREGQLLELNPSLIDASNISDRIPTKVDPEYEKLKLAIQTTGQQVPILVRVHPTKKNWYQAAYGHRRLKVMSELGLSIKAIVRSLSDHDMILAQGQENGPRQDQSFIERAIYASRLDEAGVDRDTICGAIGIDKPEVSRLLNVAANISEKIVLAIGPARKVGRPRWIAFAKLLEESGSRRRISELLKANKFTNEIDSNKRFDLGWNAASKVKETAQTPKISIVGSDGSRVGWIQQSKTGLSMNIHNAGFSKYLNERLPEILREFEVSNNADKK